MNYRLKPSELADIENFRAHHPTGRIISQYNSWNFEVGDVLVRYHMDREGTKGSVDIVSETCAVPKKFRIVHIDKIGIPWVKQISVRGGLGTKLYCLTNYALTYIWEIDPEKIDAELLGYPYDPRIEYKRMRAENPNYGGNDASD